MGLGLYLHKVVDKRDKEGREWYIENFPHLQKRFADKMYYTIQELIDWNATFDKLGLGDGYEWSGWTNDDLLRLSNGEHTVCIKEDELVTFLRLTETIKVKEPEEQYIRGSGKVKSAWFGVYDYLDDAFPKNWYKWRALTRTEEVEWFIKWFVYTKYQELVRSFLEKMNEDTFLWFCW